LPFAFHIAVQQPFKLVWSRLLLYDHETSISFDKSLMISMLPAIENLYRSSPLLGTSLRLVPTLVICPANPTGSNATASLALRVIGTHKPLYKLEITQEGVIFILFMIYIKITSVPTTLAVR
jgi:hypothetical protein